MSFLYLETIIKAANRNEFSLVIRQLWFEKTGWDPVNQARYEDYLFKFVLYLGHGMGIVLASLGILFLMPDHEDTIRWYNQILLAIGLGGVLILRGIMLFFYAIYLGMYGPARTRDDCINEPLSNFLYWMNDISLATTKSWDLQTLRHYGKELLVPVAMDIVTHKAEEPKTDPLGEEYVEWCKKSKELNDSFTEMYNSLESLKFVYGGWDFFFAEAKRRLAAQAKAQPASGADIENAVVHDAIQVVPASAS